MGLFTSAQERSRDAARERTAEEVGRINSNEFSLIFSGQEVPRTDQELTQMRENERGLCRLQTNARLIQQMNNMPGSEIQGRNSTRRFMTDVNRSWERFYSMDQREKSLLEARLIMQRLNNLMQPERIESLRNAFSNANNDQTQEETRLSTMEGIL